MLGARAIVASPGTIFRGSRLALLPKGSRRHGFGISADGVLLVRPELGVSEHGSVFGRQLGGEIVDAPVVPWREALRLVDDDHAAVLTRFTLSRSCRSTATAPASSGSCTTTAARF